MVLLSMPGLCTHGSAHNMAYITCWRCCAMHCNPEKAGVWCDAGGDFSDGDDHEGADCGGWEASEFGGAAGSTITEGGTELVSAPRRVERVDVNYSRAAKQVGCRNRGRCPQSLPCAALTTSASCFQMFVRSTHAGQSRPRQRSTSLGSLTLFRHGQQQSGCGEVVLLLSSSAAAQPLPSVNVASVHGRPPGVLCTS